METICYWADGTWCSLDELEEMTHMSDDYGTLNVEYTVTYEEIEELVAKLIRG